MDLRLDEKGIARIEKLSLDAYNENDVLIAAIERYYERTGHYPDRPLADQRKMQKLTKRRNTKVTLTGVAVKRAFALVKQKYGLGLITNKLDETTRRSIALSIIAMNLDRICRSPLCLFYDIVISKYKQHGFMLIFIQNSNAENLAYC